jgi:hypothetical protein
MSAAAGRIGIVFLLSAIAVAMVAGGIMLSRQKVAIADGELAAWGASAG